MLFSCAREKDYEKMIRTICGSIPLARVTVTEIESDRKVPAEELKELFEKYTACPVEAVPAVPEAFERALGQKGEEGTLFCVGSLYLAGSLKTLLRSGKYARF